MDHVTDNRGSIVLPNFWLPEVVPDQIKIIFTVNKNSPAHNYFVNQDYEIMDFSLNAARKKKIIESLAPSVQAI